MGCFHDVLSHAVHLQTTSPFNQFSCQGNEEITHIQYICVDLMFANLIQTYPSLLYRTENYRQCLINNITL